MWSIDEIARAEATLRERGVSVAQMLRLASVAPSLWHKWKRAESEPTVTTWNRVLGALDLIVGGGDGD